MDIIDSVELFTAINFFIIGLSHLLQPKIWVEFFTFLHAKKHFGNILNALIALSMGSLVLSFHFLWQWPKVLITVYGLIQVTKGLIYLLIPSIGIASIGKVTMDKAYKFRWAGGVLFLISIAIIYGLLN